MSKVAIISDIHGNLPGLLAVMEDISACQCNRVVCLGDLIDGGDYNNEVVQFIRDQHIPCVRGNHDEWYDSEWNELGLTQETQAFLNQLPDILVEEDTLYTHISPRAKKQSVRDEIEAWNVFSEILNRLIFIGHVHVPLVFGEQSDEFGTARLYEFEYGQPLIFNPEDRYIVCPGSVAYGRDNLKKLRYVIYDQEQCSVEFRAVEGELLPF